MVELLATDEVPRYSLVIPVCNEQPALAALFLALDALAKRLGASVEIILVDDGSRDDSAEIIKEKSRTDRRYRYIGLSRNFGQQLAITAGLDHSRGAAVIIMDADMQDPPALVPEMIAKWREGFDIVYVKSVSRRGESAFKRMSAALFYRLIRTTASIAMPDAVGEFRLIDRSVVEALSGMRERDRFLRGMFAWIGFRQVGIPFHRPPRTEGKSKFNAARMSSLAVDGLLGFSDAPLRLVVWCGFAVSLIAVLYGLYVIAMRFIRVDLVPGWSSSIVVTAFLAGMNMLMTGIVGLYVGRIHREVKKRPLYVVRESQGFAASIVHGKPVSITQDRGPEAFDS